MVGRPLQHRLLTRQDDRLVHCLRAEPTPTCASPLALTRHGRRTSPPTGRRHAHAARRCGPGPALPHRLPAPCRAAADRAQKLRARADAVAALAGVRADDFRRQRPLLRRMGVGRHLSLLAAGGAAGRRRRLERQARHLGGDRACPPRVARVRRQVLPRAAARDEERRRTSRGEGRSRRCRRSSRRPRGGQGRWRQGGVRRAEGPTSRWISPPELRRNPLWSRGADPTLTRPRREPPSPLHHLRTRLASCLLAPALLGTPPLPLKLTQTISDLRRVRDGAGPALGAIEILSTIKSRGGVCVCVCV
mmetsp:Transcript_109/g.289  ORF Transcript_109/g.289 Transcript_109/m.289 type:complete len:305 (-) Transcript_109:16-930(-)